MESKDMQVTDLCRFSYPAFGGFQVKHDSMQHKNRYYDIDFNQDCIVHAGTKGPRAKAIIKTLSTPTLALAVGSGVSRNMLNVTLTKLGCFTPITSYTDEDMSIQGHNYHNALRQKPDMIQANLEPWGAEEERHIKRAFNINSDHARTLYSASFRTGKTAP